MNSSCELRLHTHIDTLIFSEPFHISGHVFRDTPILTVTVNRGGRLGRGEAAGVYYTGDTPVRMVEALEEVRRLIEAGPSRQDLRALLPAGGARNAVDCALWELEAREAGCAVWQLAGLDRPHPLVTTMTVGAESPEKMAKDAGDFASATAIKIKLSGDTEMDIERVRAVRAARPGVWLGVDANQGYTPYTIAPLISVLVDCQVQLLEQPFARGREIEMLEIDSPITTAADESCLDLAELERVHAYFDVINVKLDKCGGLTEGLMMAERARALGLKVMVGCMPGTGRAMAAGFVLGQLCDIVDLDGPISILNDCHPTVSYAGGEIFSPSQVWGGAPDPHFTG